MDEATRERIIDRRVQERLRTDAIYRNAADAEAQALREEAITAEEEAHLGKACPVDRRIPFYGLLLPEPQVWESWAQYEARTGIGFGNRESWATFLHQVVSVKDARSQPTDEELEGPNPVVHVERYIGPMGRSWRLRKRLDGMWDGATPLASAPYVTPGFDTRAAVVRFLEEGSAA
jgi:hypothetical protein